jgi:hypothetical protein
MLSAVREFGWPLTQQQWRDATQPAPAAGAPAPPAPTGPMATPPAATTQTQTPPRRAVNPYAGQQVRLSFENTSTNLMFFVRLQSRQPDRTYVMRADTKDWIPIYPKNATMPRVGNSDPNATDANEVRLPNTLWLPAKPADKLELRVATYGEHRKAMRWMVIRGVQVQLALDSLNRSFYWLHYEVRRSDRPGDQLTQYLFPTAESYQWSMRGLWEGTPPTGAAFDATPREELRTAPATYPLTLERDHMTWTLPTGMDSIRGDPTLQASVQGQTTLTRIGPTSAQRVADLSESGSGDLIIQMTQW